MSAVQLLPCIRFPTTMRMFYTYISRLCHVINNNYNNAFFGLISEVILDWSLHLICDLISVALISGLLCFLVGKSNAFLNDPTDHMLIL